MRIPRDLLQPGLTYHLIQRGFDRCPIFRDDADRQSFLWRLGVTVRRYSWQVLAYCEMENHVHLVVRDRDGNLTDGVRALFSGYTMRFNERRHRTGHLFQGRCRTFVVSDDDYLQDVIRYVLLNPVKAGIVPDPGDWPWSSFNATAGRCAAPLWLDTRLALSPWGGDPAQFAEFVRGGNLEPEVRWNRVGRLRGM